MSNEKLRTLIRARIADGSLPTEPARQILARYADGAICDICAGATESGAITYTARMGASSAARTMLMHGTCFEIWDVERTASRQTTTG
jgi:hypothetical protein